VVEYFDIGGLPVAALAAQGAGQRPSGDAPLARPGFEAVVIGEPARAFYGNQFGLTFRLFVHYGVALWVPEVGGRIDPGSDAHDLVMSLYGGMSKGERNRIKIRVRTAMAAQAAGEGRFLGGRPPYGYRLADAGPHPNPGKASVRQRLHSLEPGPETTPVVARIFQEYASGRGLYAIAEGLTRDGILSPSAHDRTRNPHRCGLAWSKAAVRVILTNPRYTGMQVWNRQRRDEVLIDVDDSLWATRAGCAGIASRPGCAPPPSPISPSSAWSCSKRCRSGSAAARTGPAAASRGPPPHPYVLKGLIRCGVCERRMEGIWNNDRPYYWCRFPEEYALANRIEHPRSVYLREDVLTGPLDHWLAGLFDPLCLDRTIDALACAAEEEASPEDASIIEARRVLAETEVQLARYRAACDAGAEPAVVVGWIAETQARRARAEQVLRSPGHRQRMTRDEIAALARTLGDAWATLQDADPADKAEVDRQLGLELTYRPSEKLVEVKAEPPGIWRKKLGRWVGCS
jgi:hypothetical protein